MTSDESLMLEFQRGSREAFEELFARYREPLYGFFRRRLDSGEHAEDLTQETFLVVIRGTSRYEPRALVRTYLYCIALKLLASERRRAARPGGSNTAPAMTKTFVIGYTAPFDAERTGNMCAHAAQSANKASTSQSDGAAANACGCRRVAATAVIAVAATQT